MSELIRCLGCMEEYDSKYEVCPFCGYEVGTPPKEAYHMVPGTMLANRYVVGKVLGFGGFGVTYIGYDVLLNRKVAFKEYLPSEFATRIPGSTEITTYEGERLEQFNSGLDKFLEEAKMLAKFQASNGIVQIYDSFSENGTAYIVMEYLEGRTLKEYLEQVGTVSVEEAKTILHPILIALGDVHELGILHRDIAPDNIFLTTDGKVKLLDFGASRFATTSHSKSLSVIIKPGYAPVEQYRSRGDQGTWTDVYSLAATFYKMITGVTPEDSMERVEKEELKRPSKLGVKIPKNTENALMNALNIKIEDRTQNVAQLENELFTKEKVKSRFVHLKKTDVGKTPLWVKIVVPIAITIVLTFIILLATGVIKFYRIIPENFILAEGKTRVPNMINETLESAKALSDERELIVQVVDKQYSEYIPADLVLAQYTDKGKIVNVGDVVEIVVSGGRETVYMPDVTYYMKETALQILGDLGIAVNVIEEYGDSAPGTILSQSIAANEQIHRGDTVDLVVSKGYDTLIDVDSEVTVPDFFNMSFEDAIKEAKKYGIYLVKTGEEDSKAKPGHVSSQNIAAGEVIHQGDIVEILTSRKQTALYMPDVQYKDENVAVSTLKAMGLNVTVNYEENELVAKGKVISQSVAANTEVKSGQSVTIVVSLGTEKTNTIKTWSEWASSLPEGVTGSNYDIETKTVYSFRDKSLTTSYNETMDGWTLYNTETVKGEYGPWSGWSTESPASAEGRDIASKVQYSYRSYETTSSDQPTLAGWNLVNSEFTGNYTDWSGWSDWSESIGNYSNNDATEYETENKTQFRSSSRTKETMWDRASQLDGWTATGAKAVDDTSWSGWSAETTSPPAASATCQVQVSRTVPAQTKTVYCYSHYSGSGMYSQYPGTGLVWGQKSFDNPLPLGSFEYTKDSYGNPLPQSIWVQCYKEGDIPWFTYDGEYKVEISPAVTYYKYRTAVYKYEFWRWTDYGPWSDWTDTAIDGSDEVRVETRPLQRVRSRSLIYKYNYDRWTDWTAWSDDAVASSATTDVKTQTIYQYRDIQKMNKYYFYQWGGWSDWRDEKIESNENRQVQTATYYRYREK